MAATGQVAGGLTAYDPEVLTAVNAGAASLWFVGSGFIVLCHVLFKELRKFSFKLVFYLALSLRTSLVATVVRSIGNNHSHLGTWCWSQSGRTGKALNLITFHMPLWGAVLYNGFTYFQVTSMLKNNFHSLSHLLRSLFWFGNYRWQLGCQIGFTNQILEQK